MIFQFLKNFFNLPPQILINPQRKMLINNHTNLNKGKIKGYFYSEYVFGFCNIFKKVTNSLGFHLMLKTADLQDIIYLQLWLAI